MAAVCFFARRLHFICHLPSCSGNSLTGHLGKWNAQEPAGASGAKAQAKARFQPRGASFWSARTRRACLFQNFKLFQNFLFLHQHIHSSPSASSCYHAKTLKLSNGYNNGGAYCALPACYTLRAFALSAFIRTQLPHSW